MAIGRNGFCVSVGLGRVVLYATYVVKLGGFEPNECFIGLSHR